MYRYTVQCTDTMCNVLAQCAISGTVCNVLVQYAMHWYSMQCTGTMCNVLIQCAMYWYSVQYTSTLDTSTIFHRKQGPPMIWAPYLNLIYLVLKTDTSAVLMLWFICNETFFPFQTLVLSALENARSAHCERLLTETFNAIAGWWRIEHPCRGEKEVEKVH